LIIDSKKIKVGITGASGKIANSLLLRLKNEQIEVVEIKRFKSKLNLVEQIVRKNEDLDIIIDLGWNTKERDINSQSDSANSSIILSNFCKENSINFIFISSMAALNATESNYGKAKKLVEKKVDRSSTIYRPGYVLFQNNRRLESFTKLKKSRIYIPCITIETLVAEILGLIHNDRAKNTCASFDYITELREMYRFLRIFNTKDDFVVVNFVIKVFQFFPRWDFLSNLIDRLNTLIEVDLYLKKIGNSHGD
jgi:hypothetical protein